MSAASLATHYLVALTTSDLEQARSLMADDFSFRGPGQDAALDRETFLSRFGGKYEHVGKLRMLRQIEDAAGDVCSLYELDAETPAGAATFLMTEWHTVRNGRLTSALLVFDTAQGAQLHAH